MGRAYSGTTGSSILNVKGGLLTTTNNGNGNEIIIGSFGPADAAVLHAVMTVSGGTVTSGTSDIFVAQSTSGVLNIQGGLVTAGGGRFITLGDVGASTGIMNLNGGTLTGRITFNAGQAIINFNGGTFRETPLGGDLIPLTISLRLTTQHSTRTSCGAAVRLSMIMG